MDIRPYQPSDWDAIERIHDAARKNELHLAKLDEAFLPLRIAAEREDLFDYEGLDVAVISGEVVGFCAYSDEEIAWLYVAPERHRQGIGYALAAHALQKQDGVSSVEALYGNEPARRLYEKLGFTVKETVSGKMPGNESFPVRVYCMSIETQRPRQFMK